MGNIIDSSSDRSNASTDLKDFEGLEVVKAKLLSSSIYRSKLLNDRDTLQKFALLLSSSRLIKENYLLTDWKETVVFYKNLQESAKKLEDTKSDTDVKIEIDDELPSEMEIKEISEQLDSENQMVKNLRYKVKIKLVISERQQNQTEKSLKRLISPILSKLDEFGGYTLGFPEFGMFHTAIIIGPWLLEWNASGICVPRKCVSQAAFLSADLDAISTDKRLDEIIDTIAEFIQEWNTTKLYKEVPKNPKEGNCQDFVSELLERLKIDVHHIHEGALGRFLKTVRSQGNSEMEFIPDTEFRSKFKKLIEDKERIVFSNHEELDLFVCKLMDLDVDFENTHRSEWMLLKAFDRGFWLREYKYREDVIKKRVKVTPDGTISKWTPHMMEKIDDGEVSLVCACPFKDPVVTQSMRI